MGSRKGKCDLSANERQQIADYTQAGAKPAEIAIVINRHHSTVRKELQSGRILKMANFNAGTESERYDWYHSQYVADQAKTRKGRTPLAFPGSENISRLMWYVVGGYSPYAAIEQVKKEGGQAIICEQTLYRYIHSGLYEATDKNLLRPPEAKPKKKYVEPREAKNRAPGHSIDDRPKKINTRDTFGDWEGDLVVSPNNGGKSVLLTLLERKTRFGLALLVPSKAQDDVKEALDWLEKILGDVFYKLFKSVTFDNGIEFVNYEKMVTSVQEQRDSPRFEVYYAHPYRSCERGSNENYNGFLRRYFPKGTDFSKVDANEIFAKVAFINEYPRKIHKGKSAVEVFVENCFEEGIQLAGFMGVVSNRDAA